MGIRILFYLLVLSLTLLLSCKPGQNADQATASNKAPEPLKTVEQTVEANKEEIFVEPDNTETHFNLGNSLSSEGRHTEAIDAYKEAINIKPDHAEAYYNLGSAYSKSGMHKEAIDAYKKATSLIESDYTETHYNLGLTYLKLDDEASALKEYKLLKTLDPESAAKLYIAATEKALSDKDNRFLVQVGAYKNANYAKVSLEKLKSHYPNAFIEDEKGFHNVRIAGITSKKEARDIMRDINKKLRTQPFMLNHVHPVD